MRPTVGVLFAAAASVGARVLDSPGARARGRSDAPRLVLAVDVGTEAVRASCFDRSGKVVGIASAPHETQFPRSGWAGQLAADWWAGLGAAVRDALADAPDGACVDALCLATTSCTVRKTG